MKTDFSPSNKGWSDVTIVAIITLVIVAFFVLLGKFAQEDASRLSENENTYARCKSVGGEMGYSKCYKNGKEI
jgi:hypothetical protein